MKLKIAILLILSVINCKAQGFTKKEPMDTFDIEKFDKNKNHRKEYADTLYNGTIIKQRERKREYIETIKYKDKHIEDFNSYHKNGKLKIQGYFLENDFYKGIWKEYDEQGNLIKETDYDKGFDYTWEDLLKLLKKREVDIKDTGNTTIRKDEGEWWVYYVEGLYIYNIRIDGKTGKILLDDKDLFEEGS